MRSKKYDVSKTAEALGYSNNKDVKFKYITGIHIDKFRSLQNRDLTLGKYITVITGKNGTMKSSMLGLIAHPFSSPNNAKDFYENDLKTDMRDVFKLSMEKDDRKYIYYIKALTSKNEELFEPVRLYRRPTEKRHRVTVGRNNEEGRGNFSLNTSIINLSRIYPMIETDSHVIDVTLSNEEKEKVSNDYMNIMQREAFKNFETVTDTKIKNTCGPKDAYYDFNSISSGEDNLGAILYKLLAFERAKSAENDCLQGLICIDEFEASLHPVAQVRFFNFLLHWAKINHMQIVITTHSLYLIYHCLALQNNSHYEPDSIIINNISTMQVGRDNNYNFMKNPDYKTIYRELTYLNPDETPPYKVNVICEDKEASSVIKKLLGSKITKNIAIITDISGTNGSPWKGLVSLAKNGQRLLEDSIIVLDGDVDESSFNNLSFNYIMKLYDPDNLCIEKRIIYFISQLNGDESIFADKEKNSFMADIEDYNIDLKHIKTQDVRNYKKWRNGNARFYQKALSLYLKEKKSDFAECKNQMLKMINDRRCTQGLPPI